MLLWCLWACHSESAPDPMPPSTVPTASTASTGDTGEPPTDDPFDVDCVEGSNVLRRVCTITLPAPAAVDLQVVSSDGHTARIMAVDDTVAAVHTIPVGFMRSATSYVVTAKAGDDVVVREFRTGRLPPPAAVEAHVEGVSSAAYIGMASPCPIGAVVTVLDPEGQVVWFEDFGRFSFGFLEGVSFTDEGTILGLLDAPDAVIEVDWLGNLVGPVPDADATHHDAFRRNGNTYLIFQEEVDGFRIDGVRVIDPSGRTVGSWRLADHVLPLGNREVEPDFSHANAVWVEADGHVVVSFRHLSTVMRLPPVEQWGTDDDPVWIMVGDPDEDLITPTLTMDGVDFVQQHNIHGIDGEWMLFDNRLDPREKSRLLRFTIDADTVRPVEAWTLDDHCPYQGGAWVTSTGNPVATCAPLRTGYELVSGQPDPVWSMQVDCQTSPVSTYVPRFVPLTESLEPPGYR